MRELNEIQKIVIRQWFNKKNVGRYDGYVKVEDMPFSLYQLIESIHPTEILSQEIDQYLEELTNN